jgi:hypothetical protein
MFTFDENMNDKQAEVFSVYQLSGSFRSHNKFCYQYLHNKSSAFSHTLLNGVFEVLRCYF